MAEEERLARLAKQIGEDIRKEQHLVLTDSEVIQFRRQGASQLYAICADFASSVNRLLTPPVVEITPSDYAPDLFRNSAPNLIQLNTRGRIVQVAFESTRARFSTDKFLIPYILEGEVRAYNQEMLERSQVRSQALFYCVGEQQRRWHYYEWVSGRTGLFSRDQLLSLMERIV